MVPARGCGKGEGGRRTLILIIEDFKTCTMESSANASLKAQAFPELNIKNGGNGENFDALSQLNKKAPSGPDFITVSLQLG